MGRDFNRTWEWAESAWALCACVCVHVDTCVCVCMYVCVHTQQAFKWGEHLQASLSPPEPRRCSGHADD